MKVILLENVAKLGQRYNIKDVKNGYALNFLLPRGLAEFASAEAIAAVEAKRGQIESNRQASEETIVKGLQDMSESALVLTAKANEQGHLFAVVHAADVLERLKEASGVDVPERYVSVPGDIKEVGEYELMVMVGEYAHKVTLTVEAEK